MEATSASENAGFTRWTMTATLHTPCRGGYRSCATGFRPCIVAASFVETAIAPPFLISTWQAQA